MSKLLYQGHGSYRITTNEGVVIYIDPYIGDGYNEEADIILVTHEHSDHNRVELVKLKSDGVIIRQNNLKIGSIYHSTSIKGVGIEAVEAYNKNHNKANCVGYVLRFDGISLYASGDTSMTDDMRNKLPKYNLDYALLPCDGIYNMDVDGAIECAKVIKARVSIPIHTNPSMLFDESIANRFIVKGRKIIKPNEEINL